jgi:hypothetical protein
LGWRLTHEFGNHKTWHPAKDQRAKARKKGIRSRKTKNEKREKQENIENFLLETK